MQSGQTADNLDGLKLAESNPRFMWLLRDVILDPTDAKGSPCHIRDYLLQKVSAMHLLILNACFCW